MEPVPVHRGGQAVKEGVALVVGLKLLLCLLLGNELSPGHVGDGLDIVLKGAGLILGQGVLNVGRELVFLLQIAEHIGGIHCHQGKRTHDEQAAYDHAHGREGHQAVGKDAAEALHEEIAKIISLFHYYNTRLSRR